MVRTKSCSNKQLKKNKYHKMATENVNRFLDENGVLKLWNKIYTYFSEIGHHHETSDVDGLDEYMEENSRAIRDVEWNIIDVEELPEFPSKGDKDKVVRYNDELYRAVELSSVTIDFTEITGKTSISSDEIAEMINKNGHIIKSDYIHGSSLFSLGGYLITPDSFLTFYQKDNDDNKIYFTNITFNGQAFYHPASLESVYTYINVLFDSFNYEGFAKQFSYNAGTEEETPEVKECTVNFLSQINEPIHYLNFKPTSSTSTNRTIIRDITFDLISAENEEEFNLGHFYTALAWKKIELKDLDIDTTAQSATTETMKRFYRTPDNVVNVTDQTKEEQEGITIDFVSNTTSQLGQYTIYNLLNSGYTWVDKIEDYYTIYGGKVNGGIYDGVEIGYRRTNEGLLSFTANSDFKLSICPYFYYNGQEYGTSVGDTRFTIDGTEYIMRQFTTIEELPDKTMTFELSAGTHTIQTIKTTGETGEYIGSCIRLTKSVIGDYFPAEFAWNQVVRKSELVPVAKTNSYTDLDDQPTIGDVQVFDYDSKKILPEITDDYLKKLLRWNNCLYTAIFNDSGYEMYMNFFSTWAHDNYTTYSWDNNRDEIFRSYMFKRGMGIDLDYTKPYFISSNKMNVRHTFDIGLQIGTSGSGEEGYGHVLIAMRPINESKDEAYYFSSVTVTLQSYNIIGSDENREIVDYTTQEGNAYVEIGTSVCEQSGSEYIHTLTPQKVENYHFATTTEEGELMPVETKTFTLSGTGCDYLKIYTASDTTTETYGYRCIVTDIKFNDLMCYSPQSTAYTRQLYKRKYWKQISGDGGLTLIDIED